MEVWQWLDEFRASNRHLVLDIQGQIYDEYTHKLGFNDFGIQVVMHKWSTAAIDDVDVMYDFEGHGLLPATLAPVIHDMADRKMVAAALAAEQSHGTCPIAFAGDTDWHGWENALTEHGVSLVAIIERWSRAKFETKTKP